MKNILIIEDSKIINNIIKKELKKSNFNVSQAYTLSEAKKILDSKKFQLIILDLHLPDGEGSELIANIQSLTKTKVVVLTSSHDNKLREEMFEFGVLDYIIKDKNILYSISEITKIINNISTKSKDKIIVIDDSNFICKQIKTILEPRNYIVKSANKAKDGLKMLKNDVFDLIILDMELPDIHGAKVLEEIRKDKRFINTPIIVLSGTSTPQIIRDVLKNGANDFLKKPFVYEEFILKVDLWNDYFKKTKELEEKTLRLQFINKNLEKIVIEEVEKNRKKDRLLFTHSRHAQMGEMIAMIAHQWRQPLNSISAAINLIKLRSQMGKLDHDTVINISDKIQVYIKYLSNTIDDFREFFRPQREKRLSDFHIIYEKAFILIGSSLEKKGISIDFTAEDIKQFFSYENEIVQVVINILKNASDAFSEKNIKNPTIKVNAYDTTLLIQDNAGGIPENIIDKIFDPYFSTKDNKNGTGLGLYMSKIIIEEHCKGSISVENKNNGAVFTITLPKNKT